MSDARALDAICALAGGAVTGELRPLPEGLDAGGLTALARRHRVTILAARQWARLHAAGLAAPVPPALTDAAGAAQRRSLAAIAALAGLAAAFDREAIAWMPLKGPVLSLLAHGDPALRVARDLDVLVAPDRLGDAVAAAQALGWQVAADWARVAALTGKRDLELAPGRPGQPVLEIHSAIDAGRPGFRWHPLDPAPARIGFAGRALPVPDRESLIVYVAWHGARHFWFRLNWLVDLAALLAGGVEGDRLIARARAMGAEKGLRAGMLLVDQLLGVPLPPVPSPERGMATAAAALAEWGALRIALDPEDPRIAARPASFLWTLREWRVEDRPWRQLAPALAALARPREPDVRRLGVGAPLALHLLARPLLLAERVGSDLAGRGRRRG